MSAGSACRPVSRLLLSLPLVLAATTGSAADTDPGCQTFVDSQWQPAKAASMSGCLLQLDAATATYDAQGFKFGLWGTTLLSADVRYFYSSLDSGASWQVVGEKAAITPDTRTPRVAQAVIPTPTQVPAPAVLAVEADQATTVAAAPTPLAKSPAVETTRVTETRVVEAPAVETRAVEAAPATKSAGIFSRITDFFMTPDDLAEAREEEALAPRPVTAEMPAPASVARDESPVIPMRNEPAVTIVSQAPNGEPVHSCNMRLGSRWEVINNRTLDQCIALFDSSPDQFDTNGYKYGYWGGIYLAANRSEVLQSTNSREWTTVLNR